MPRFRKRIKQKAHSDLGEAALDWSLESNDSVLAYGFRHGVYHLMSSGQHLRAEKILTTFKYNIDRLSVTCGDGARPLAIDFAAMKSTAKLSQPAQFELWEDFVRTRVHLLEREKRADKVLLQLAVEHADDSPVTREAESWLADGHCDWFWLRRTHRPKMVSISDCLRVFDCGSSVRGMTCDGNSLMSWTGSRIQVWNLATGEEACVFDNHSNSISGARFVHSGLALSWSWDHTLRIWDPLDAGEQQVYQGHSDYITGLLPLNAHRMVSWSKDKSLRIWSLSEGENEPVLSGHESAVAGAVSLSENRILSWSTQPSDHRFLIWNAVNGECLDRKKGPSDSILAVQSGTGRVLCAKDDALWVEGYDGAEHVQLEGHEDDLCFGRFLPDGRVLSGDWAGEMRLWDGDSGTLLQCFGGHAGSVAGGQLLGDDRMISWDDNTIRLWELETGLQLKTFEGHSGSICAVQIFNDGRFVSASYDGTLRLWKTGHAQREADRPQHSEGIWGTLELPGNRVLTWSEDGDLRIWDRQNGQCLATMTGHTDMIQGACVLPDGRIASWSGDASIRLWDSLTGESLCSLVGHSDYILGTLLLNDTTMVSWSFDGSLRTWDLKTNRPLKAIESGGGKVLGAVRLDDGRILYQAKDRRLRTWDAHSEEPQGNWAVPEALEVVPKLVDAYKNRKTKPETTSDRQSFYSNRSTVIFEGKDEAASWQGEGQWTARHGLGDTLVATNDKQIVFLQLWHGNRRLLSSEMRPAS